MLIKKIFTGDDTCGIAHEIPKARPEMAVVVSGRRLEARRENLYFGLEYEPKAFFFFHLTILTFLLGYYNLEMGDQALSVFKVVKSKGHREDNFPVSHN